MIPKTFEAICYELNISIIGYADNGDAILSPKDFEKYMDYIKSFEKIAR